MPAITSNSHSSGKPGHGTSIGYTVNHLQVLMTRGYSHATPSERECMYIPNSEFDKSLKKPKLDK